MKFTKATDDLMSAIGLNDIANEIGCSPQSVKQARAKEGSVGFRNPPAGWEKAIETLAEKQSEHFRKLAERLRSK